MRIRAIVTFLLLPQSEDCVVTTVRNSLRRRSRSIHSAAILMLLIGTACGAQLLNPNRVNVSILVIGVVAANLGMALEMTIRGFTDEKPPGPYLLAMCVGGGFVGVVGGLSAPIMIVLLLMNFFVLLLQGGFQAGNLFGLCVLPPFIVMLAVEYWFALRFVEDLAALVKHLETSLATLANSLVVIGATIISVCGVAILFWELVA